MNAHHDELERMLGRDLHRQVDGMVDLPLGLRDVKGRAGRIRRNRRIAAGVGVAAALAVIVPTALTTGGMLEGSREIAPAPSPSRSVAPSPDVPAEVSRTTLTLDGLSRGAAPAIEYFTPDGVVLPGEGLQRLPVSYQALVRSEAQGGWIALGPAKDEVLYLSEDFEQQGGGSASNNELVSTPQRDYVAWTMPEPGAQTLGVRSTTDPDEVTSWDFPERPVVEPVGILGPDSVVYETISPQGDTTVGTANPDGSITELPYLAAYGVDPVNGFISVLTEVEGSSGCFGVFEVASQDLAWETCEYKLGAFSPDGALVMATGAESDSSGLTSLYVLDARTGDLVAEFSSRGPTPVNLVGASWESADSIIAPAGQGTTLTMIRLGIDGSIEEVADRFQGNVFGDFPYYLGVDRTVL